MNGSVFKRCPCTEGGKHTSKRCKKDHGSWYFVHDVPSIPGTKRRRARKGGFACKTDAETALTESMTRYRQRGAAAERDLKGRRQFVANYLPKWLESRTRLKPTTRASYADHINRFLIPHLGHLRLEDLGATDIEEMYAKLRKLTRQPRPPKKRRRSRCSLEAEDAKPALPRPRLSAASISRIHATLRKALNDAVRRYKYLDYNPALFVELERVERPEADYWTTREAGAFLDAIVDDRLYALYHLAVYRGLRRGEIIALRWEDLDLADDDGYVEVRRNRVQVGYKVSEGSPKSYASRRTIWLDADTVAVLKEHRKQQRRERWEGGDAYEDHGLVFAKADGSPLHPEFASRHLDVLVKRVRARRITFHQLRHTAASLMLEAGFELKYVQHVLGHADINITGTLYTHVTRRLDQRRSGQVAEMIPRQRLLPGTATPDTRDQAVS